MPLNIYDTIKPKGEFPAVGAEDVLMPDGSRLSEVDFEGSGGGNGSNMTVDQTYNSKSSNAQSGVAVAEGIELEKMRANTTFANALKGSKSGSVILIDDVSPVTHEMSVKVRCENLFDLTSVKVNKLGENLLNIHNRVLADNSTDTIVGSDTYRVLTGNQVFQGICVLNWYPSNVSNFSISNGTVNFTNTVQYNDSWVYGIGFDVAVKPNVTYTFSIISEQGQIHLGFYDKNGKYLRSIKPENESEYNSITVTTNEDEYWCILSIIMRSETSDNVVTVTNMQLELGNTATEYEPYIEPITYTPNADGTVDGVTSLYPNTTLMTDIEGVIIDCEYNRDINKFSDIDVDVPTKTSELINDSNFATQDYVDEEIANFDFIKIVTELPETGLVNRTYFVPKQDAATNDLYDEFMWVDGKWELITTKQIEVDLTEYVKYNDIFLKIYPIGSIYISAASTSPSSLFGGTWEQIKDTFLLAAGDTYTLGATGGEAEHTLTANEMPTHRHPMYTYAESASDTASGSDYVGARAVHLNYTADSRKTYWHQLFQAETGGNQPHNNMPPYLAVYVWKRIA